MAVDGKAVAMAVAGGIVLYTGITDPKGNPKSLLQKLLQGKTPAPPSSTPSMQAASGGGGAPGVPGAHASQILAVAAGMKGQPYGFGRGHVDPPCSDSLTDCSSYVSCVLYKVGLTSHTMATGELSGFGTGVTYDQRAPGDLIVWNGGTGGGHVGIIVDGGTMWNNPCTTCGGVQISHYPYGERTASAAVIRRP